MKWITGTWLDFRHPNPYDGYYWNGQTARFRKEQWDGKVGEMHSVGMDTLVIMSVALAGKAFYPSAYLKERWPLACDDPIKAVLDAAHKRHMQVFVGLGFRENVGAGPDTRRESVDWHRHLADDLQRRYGHHPAFFGWYLANETAIHEIYPEKDVHFIRAIADHCHQISHHKPVLIAPYGTNRVKECERFVEQLHELHVDHIAYQDEVGVRKTRVEQLPAIFARLERLHKKAGIPLWADVEIFEFEGDTYKSPLIPAPVARIQRQVEIIGPYVERMLCYQYLGLMNPPDSPQFCGHPSSARLYEDYMAWRKSGKP